VRLNLVHLALHGLSRQQTGSTRKNIPENDGFVMQLVASSEDERERIVSRHHPKIAEEFSFMGELSLVIYGGTRPIGSGHARTIGVALCWGPPP
jgi:hypothetical protein